MASPPDARMGLGIHAPRAANELPYHGKDDLLGVYKQEHAADFREAAHRPDLCPDLWYEMDEICASAQHGGFNYRFYHSPDFYSPLIRIRSRPGELHDAEIVSAGKWVTGPPSVTDAISGMGDDPYSGPSWYADPLTPEQARARAAEHGIELFGPNADAPDAGDGR